MIKALFRWLLTDPAEAQRARRAPAPAPSTRAYDLDSDPYGEDYGCNSIFGMG